MNDFPSRKEVERIKKMYPKGTRIQIERMNDPYHPIERGTKGTVDYVDDAGTLHCTFDNGRSLGVVHDADIFHVIDRLNVPIAERYACLLGSAIDGNKRLHNVQEVAEFICKHGQYGDVRITTMEGKELLDTFGIYINRISDMEYREELLKVLVPMQHEVENAAFSDDEDMLDRRDDLAEVRDHYLGIAGQHDFTVTAKPTQEMKFYCPLVIQAEPQYDEDEAFDYDDYEVIPSSCAGGCEDEINAAIEKYSEPEEEHRGLMVYYDANSPVNEKVVSAFPSVEVRNGELVGVLTCRLTEPLTDSEMKEFQDWWTGQCSDGWSEGFEQREIKTDSFGTIYVSFWNSSDSWQIETEMIDTADIEEEESLDMGGISM